MPPQETNLASEPEDDCAVLELAPSIALVEATDGTLAARPNASIVDDALPEKDGAELTAASTRNFFGPLRRFWFAVWERWQRQNSRVTLHDLSDRELMDIGVTRGEIDRLDRHRAVNALRDRTYLWIQSRGVM